MSTLNAWLYLDRMELSQYWPEDAELGWEDFYSQSQADKISIDDCQFLSPQKKQAYHLAFEATGYLPEVPTVDVPRPISPGLIALNEPDQDSLVLVTVNNSFTFEVLSTIWAQGVTPTHILLVDCGGNTLDMSLVFKKFTPDALAESIQTTDLASRVSHRNLLMPGLAFELKDDFARITGWNIDIGPICAAEIPLFLRERWIIP